MSSTLSYNGYTFPPDMSWFTINRVGIVGGTGRLIKVRNIWDCHSRVNTAPGLSGAPALGDLDTKIKQVEAAMRDGGDLIFSLGSSMRLISSDCTEGTHIKNFSWNKGTDGVNGFGAEQILRRSCSFTIYGDILVTTDTDIIEYQDSLRAIGSGGPRIVPVTSLSGGVQAQQLTATTPFYAIQSGYATGLRGYPTPPLPNYQFVGGVFYFPETLEVDHVTPKSWGRNINTGFTVRWSYRCWSAIGLLGTTPGVF